MRRSRASASRARATARCTGSRWRRSWAARGARARMPARGARAARRAPAGTSLSVNLSAPVLLEPATTAHARSCRRRARRRPAGLIVEITEETLVHSDTQLSNAIAPLRARGARLAVDDMGAGYSGLRQITAVHPSYLKLDRSLVSAIHGDGERAALVQALAGYSIRSAACSSPRESRRRTSWNDSSPRRAAGAGLLPQPARPGRGRR